MVNCRGCRAQLSLTFLDLGASPIANDLISAETLVSPEVFYPLHVMTDRRGRKSGGGKHNVTKNNVKIIERCLRKNRKTGRE